MTPPPSNAPVAAPYWAFISYSHKDKAWADWLHKALETYRIPQQWVGTRTSEGELPARLLPIFRDRDELPTAADLTVNINSALQTAKCLIVICSPHAARSQWVNQEIIAFKRLGKSHRILGIIVDGEPNSGTETECFPEALRFHFDDHGQQTHIPAEPIAADIRKDKDGRDNAKLKLIAGITGLPYDTLRQRDRQRRKKQQRLVSAAASLMIALFSWLSAQVYFQHHARQVAAAESLIKTGITHLEQGELPLGVAQIGAATALGLPELKDYTRLNSFWLARLQPLPKALTAIASNSVFLWQTEAYFVNANRELLRLGNHEVIAWAITANANHLFVISEPSAHQWQVDTYHSDTLQPLGSYPIDKYQRDAMVLANPAGTDTLLLQTATESSYAGGVQHALLSLQANAAKVLLSDYNLYLKHSDCSATLQENSDQSLTYNDTFQTASERQYRYLNDPDKRRSRAQTKIDFEQQLQQQGLIFTKENRRLESYIVGQQILQLDTNYRHVDTWINPWDEDTSLSELCGAPAYGQPHGQLDEQPQDDTFGDDVTRQILSLTFPQTLPETALWTAQPLKSEHQPASPMTQLQQVIDHSGEDNTFLSYYIKSELKPAERESVLEEIWAFAMAQHWQVTAWPATIDEHSAQQLLLQALTQRIDTIPSEYWDSLLSSHDTRFIQHADTLWFAITFVDGNSAFQGRLICAVDIARQQFRQCLQDSAPLTEQPQRALGNLLIYSTYKIMGTESFEVFDVQAQRWVTPTQTPGTEVDISDVQINATGTRLVVLEDDALWSYARNDIDDDFQLQLRVPRTGRQSQFSEAEYIDPQGVRSGSPVVFSSEDEVIFADSPTSIQKINLATGISQWRSNTSPARTAASDVVIHFISDATHTYVLTVTAVGMQLFHQKTGMALSEFVPFASLPLEHEQQTGSDDAQSGSEEEHSLLTNIDIDLRPDGEVRVRRTNTEWLRAAPQLITGDLRARTAREGEYGEKNLTRLPE